MKVIISSEAIAALQARIGFQAIAPSPLSPLMLHEIQWITDVLNEVLEHRRLAVEAAKKAKPSGPTPCWVLIRGGAMPIHVFESKQEAETIEQALEPQGVWLEPCEYHPARGE